MKVRLARYDDITRLVIFAKSQHSKSTFKDLQFNPSLFRKSLRELIKSGNSDILVSVNKEGQIRGMLMAWHEALTWHNRPAATDIHFVAEQGGDMLLRAFKAWAKEKNCSEICVGTFNEKDEDIIEKLYNRIGFRTVGKTYRMELV